jgi:hypothetical protein
MERAFRTIGPEGDFKAFNEALGRTSVQRCTEVHSKHDGGFAMVRNAFFRGEGIGRKYLLETLPHPGIM